jgi:gliding motility-associated-like protein
MGQRLFIFFFLMPIVALGQTEFVVNLGTDIRINPGCQVILAEGGIRNSAGQLSNAGELVVEGNILNDATLVGGTGSGMFRVLNDIENNGQMQPGQSEFELYGDDQVMHGVNQLDFHHLTLIGGGVKYMLQDISTTGNLNLTDRELSAGNRIVFHQNTAAASVLAIHDQGFVSATANGGLSRVTNSTQDHYFPVGTSVGGIKVRPITISPNAGNSTYKVRYAAPSPNAAQRSTELYYINPVFYHHMERTSGSSPATITVYFDEPVDGFFQTLAHYGSGLWRENPGTVAGPVFGSGPELASFRTPGWDFETPEISLAALATELFVPNVFSPNDDGQNDVFKPRGTNLFEFEMRIYDRWGNCVFESEDIDTGWDGTFKGQPVNSGVFVYFITSAGQVVSKGNVTLLR